MLSQKLSSLTLRSTKRMYCSNLVKNIIHPLRQNSNNLLTLTKISNNIQYISSQTREDSNLITLATFEDVKEAEHKENIMIIDVRDPFEIQDTGNIPGSINIPLDELEDTLTNMPHDEFKTRYGRKKPGEGFPIIFTCKSGKRGERARQLAIKLGFRNVKNFEGGWLKWKEREE